MVKKGTLIEVVKNDLPMIAGKIDQQAEQAVRETTLFIESQAKSDAPIGPTGNLASAISSEMSAVGDGFRGEVFDSMDYAAYVNYGTGSRGSSSAVPERPAEITYTGSWLGMTARPFMSQAAADARPRFDAALKKIGTP